jgi:sugar phosphate isomerase/epimerase
MAGGVGKPSGSGSRVDLSSAFGQSADPNLTNKPMQLTSLSKRLAVCSWSLQPATPEELLRHLDTLGIRRVQLALDPLRDQPAVWGRTAALFAQNGVEVVSGMFGTIGEDYTTLESIKRTGGVVPDQHWEQNWKNIQAVSEVAESLRLKLVTFHAGFLPHEAADPATARLLERIGKIADWFAGRGIQLGFETGQEEAVTLRSFLVQLKRPNVGVNFDPANMLLYDQGDPIEAVRTLGPWLKQCHIKDARRTKTPGTWGEEVVVGTGEVDWPAFLSTLRSLNYQGALCIEREAGQQRAADILAAKQLLERLTVAD